MCACVTVRVQALAGDRRPAGQAPGVRGCCLLPLGLASGRRVLPNPSIIESYCFRPLRLHPHPTPAPGTILQVTAAEAPTVVEFMAPWCGKCRQMGPFMDGLVDKYPGIKVGPCCWPPLARTLPAP